MADSKPDLMTVDEVAAVLRTNRKTLLNRRSRGLGQVGFRIGRVVLFDRILVEQYLREQQAADTIGARSASPAERPTTTPRPRAPPSRRSPPPPSRRITCSVPSRRPS
jgi:hypothetical protein